MIAVLAAVVLAQAPSGAAPTASTPLATPAPVPAAKPVAAKMICRTLPQTGSMFGGPRECHSKAEWDAFNAAARDNMNNYEQRTNQGWSPPR